MKSLLSPLENSDFQIKEEPNIVLIYNTKVIFAFEFYYMQEEHILLVSNRWNYKDSFPRIYLHVETENYETIKEIFNAFYEGIITYKELIASIDSLNLTKAGSKN